MHTSDHPARRSTAAALVITALFVLTQLYSAIPLIGPVSTDLGRNATFALSTSFSLCYALGFLIWGPIADHYGRRTCLLIGMTLLTVATLSCAVTTSLGALAVARCIQGITAASFSPIALAYLSDSTPPAWRGTAIGAMSTAFLVAGIFGQVTAQAITERWGWHWVFGASALILFICAGAIAVLMRDRTTRTPYSSLIDQFTRVGALLTTPTILLLCSAHVTLLLVFVAMYTALGPHLVTLGYPHPAACWLAGYVCGTCGREAITAIQHNYPRSRGVYPGCCGAHPRSMYAHIHHRNRCCQPCLCHWRCCRRSHHDHIVWAGRRTESRHRHGH